MSTRYGNSKPSKRVSETDQQNEQRPDWVSVRAVAWALDEAPVPAELLATLIAIARCCDANGRGSRQAHATIAEKTGVSEKQAQRNVSHLREKKLIRLGDQSLVDHLPPGRRPTVYDLPLDMKGPKPVREPRNKNGINRRSAPPLEGVPSDAPRPPMQGGSTAPMHRGSTPPLQSPPSPPMEGGQRTLRKTHGKTPSKNSLSAAAPDVAAREGEREPDQAEGLADQPDAYPVQRRHLTPLIKKYPQHTDRDWVDRLIRTIETDNKVGGLGWWRTVAANGDLAVIVEELHYLVDTLTPPKPRHPWCGKCDQHTRKISGESGYGCGIVMQPCPTCSDKADPKPAGKKPGHTPFLEGHIDPATYLEPF